MARSYIDSPVSFQEFFREAQRIAIINKRVSERRAAERQPKPKLLDLQAVRMVSSGVSRDRQTGISGIARGASQF